MNKKSKTHTMDNILNSHVSCRLHHTILLLNRQIHRPLQGYNTLVVVDDPLSRLCGTQHVTQNVSSFPEHLQSKYHFTWDANLKFSKKLAEHHFLFFLSFNWVGFASRGKIMTVSCCSTLQLKRHEFLLFFLKKRSEKSQRALLSFDLSVN